MGTAATVGLLGIRCNDVFMVVLGVSVVHGRHFHGSAGFMEVLRRFGRGGGRVAKLPAVAERRT